MNGVAQAEKQAKRLAQAQKAYVDHVALCPRCRSASRSLSLGSKLCPAGSLLLGMALKPRPRPRRFK